MFQNKYLSLVALLFLFCQTTAGLYRSVNTIKSLKPLRPVIQNVGISQLTRMPVVPAMPKFSTTGENPITPLVYPQNLRPGSPDFVYKNQHMNFMPSLSSIDFSQIFLDHKVSGISSSRIFFWIVKKCRKIIFSTVSIHVIPFFRMKKNNFQPKKIFWSKFRKNFGENTVFDWIDTFRLEKNLFN